MVEFSGPTTTTRTELIMTDHTHDHEAEIWPIVNPETGAEVYPHFDSDGETITPERIARAEARRAAERSAN